MLPKNINGYDLLKAAKTNILTNSYIEFVNYGDDDLYSFTLIIDSMDEFNTIISNIEIIHNELMFESRLFLASELLSFIIQNFDSSNHYRIFKRVYNVPWDGSRCEIITDIFLERLYGLVKDDTEKVCILNKVKLLDGCL